MIIMKLVALFSGGKDSTYAIQEVIKQGHEVVFLATVSSENPESFMFHTINIGLTFMQSRCMEIQFVSKRSEGIKEEEINDLEVLLKGLDVEGVVCGAVASKYQKERVEKVCKKLGLELITPLWAKNPEELLREMVKDGFEIIIVDVAADGFDESWLGRKIDEKTIDDLKKLNKKYGINMVGEGGEMETFVLDCPLFKRKLEITEVEKKWEDNRGKYIIKDAKFADK